MLPWSWSAIVFESGLERVGSCLAKEGAPHTPDSEAEKNPNEVRAQQPQTPPRLLTDRLQHQEKNGPSLFSLVSVVYSGLTSIT